uniref:Uncharacterized protein n=1 Tax=viral metagenome TaxID=1070528 RepID=A0A6C0CAF6_9ZZZZ
MINPTYLTKSSQDKYIDMKISNEKLDPKLKKILDIMLVSFKKNLIIESKSPTKLQKMQKIFIQFHNMFSNIRDSKFVSDVKKFNKVITYTLDTPHGIITLNFLYDKNKIKVISAITHALHTFCNFFNKIDYDGLVIYVCLDDNKRDIIIFDDRKTYDEKIAYLQKNSLALNVSGMTDKNKKIVFLTRTEEIVKLLFHEMVHYIGLDEKLRRVNYTNNWAVAPVELNISETYTEFMAVLLNAAYQSIYIWCLDPKKSIDQIYRTILNMETIYSLRLTANILKFYGYDSATYENFFKGIGHKNSEAIPLWEYIFLRTICMMNMTFFPSNYVMNDVATFVKLLKNDRQLVENLEKYMSGPMDLNISYNMIDLDWEKHI